MTEARTHRRRRLTGRNPLESHRAVTRSNCPCHLTFVVAFGQAANELAHMLAEGRIGSGAFAFCFATFAISWAIADFPRYLLIWRVCAGRGSSLDLS